MNKHFRNILLALTLAVVLSACQRPLGNQTGSEYMPDMAHSIAYEANTYNYYGLNTWDDESVKSLYELAAPRKPVKGTVPRGYAGKHQSDNGGIVVPANGHVPYHYDDTDAERTRATTELTMNPFPITEAGLETGENLYNIYCGVCHGTGGDFKDGIYEKGIYPAAPANLVNDEFTAATPGRFYHAIMYGKNVMGSYTDKLSYEERWQVIHYIRSLQAKAKKAEYSEEANTLNAFATPGAAYSAEMHQEPAHEMEEEAHGDDDHGHDNGHGHSDHDDHGHH